MPRWIGSPCAPCTRPPRDAKPKVIGNKWHPCAFDAVPFRGGLLCEYGENPGRKPSAGSITIDKLTAEGGGATFTDAINRGANVRRRCRHLATWHPCAFDAVPFRAGLLCEYGENPGRKPSAGSITIDKLTAEGGGATFTDAINRGANARRRCRHSTTWPLDHSTTSSTPHPAASLIPASHFSTK